MSEPAPIVIRGTSRQCESCPINLRMPWRKKYACPYCLIEHPRRFAITDDVCTLVCAVPAGPGRPAKRFSASIAVNRLSPRALSHLRRRGLLVREPATPRPAQRDAAGKGGA